MTPKELCDLAAKINAAVPGLVPEMNWNQEETWGHTYVVLYGRNGDIIDKDDAAAMMLGRCWVWRRENIPANKQQAWDVISEAIETLADAVATTLPKGAADGTDR